MVRIDINCDMGESYGAFPIGEDARLMPHISSANIACGFHGGDPCTMRATVAAAVRGGVGLGAHPGLPDLMGFGRRVMAVSADETYAYMQYQVGALQAFARAAGRRVAHVKPHGALYNMAAKDAALAGAIARAIADLDKDLILLGPPDSAMEAAAGREGIRFAAEFFLDRAYNDDGSLVPRGHPGAMLEDVKDAVDRAVGMIRHGVVRTLSGGELRLTCRTICVHGDGAHAADMACALADRLRREGIEMAPLGQIMG